MDAILIASTCWWPFPARLAMAFAAAGYTVEAICPAHHPLLNTRAVSRAYAYNAFRPLASLERAIQRANPALIVPCDDRAVSHLHTLHARPNAGISPEASIIRRSLGDPANFQILERRSQFIAIARETGVLAPETVAITSIDDLLAVFPKYGRRGVLKVDGSWGGLGVEIVHTVEDARTAFMRMSRPVDFTRAVKRVIVDRDPFSIMPWLERSQPVVNLQRYIEGQPANCAVACWDGEVLASIAVEVLSSRGQIGNSTVVRVVDHRQMQETAKSIVRRLGLSGICGLDFMIEVKTGDAYLIEINPRSTPLSHFALGPGRNLVAALSAKLRGDSLSATMPITTNDIIAFFPQAWFQDPASEFLRTGFHDVPWEEPELLCELIKLPWPDRGVLARLLASVRELT